MAKTWKLKEIKVENQYNNIPWGKLETARPVDVTKELLNYYGEHYRVEVTIQVLRSIHRRDLADRLTKATQAVFARHLAKLQFCQFVDVWPQWLTS
uniref:Pyrin domain-containing protein n=1 Tax=Gopherus agassizii TaxID=38772 RepID=A0A452ISB7_9SAUR